MWRELAIAAVIVIAVVIRGWPRRRNDRWSLTFRIDRDRSDPDRSDPDKEEEPPPP